MYLGHPPCCNFCHVIGRLLLTWPSGFEVQDPAIMSLCKNVRSGHQSVEGTAKFRRRAAPHALHASGQRGNRAVGKGRSAQTTRGTAGDENPLWPSVVAPTFSFFLSSALLAGLGLAGPPKGPPPTSPLRWAALTLGGVMAAAAEVRGMRGRAPGVGGWWPCCGDTVG